MNAGVGGSGRAQVLRPTCEWDAGFMIPRVRGSSKAWND